MNRSGLAIMIGLGLTAMPLARAQDKPAGDGAAPARPLPAAYRQHCAACHGDNMTDGRFAPPLKGPAFLAKWGGTSAEKLGQYIQSSMPPASAGTLDAASYQAVLGAILAQNGVSQLNRSPQDAPVSHAEILLPRPPAARGEVVVGGESLQHPLPAWPMPANPLDRFTPVSEAELDDPAAQDWPAWRRSHLGQGYSPLKQINAGTVKQLRLVWSQALPAGDNTAEPLVRGGVLYTMGAGDEIFAFDAATGRQLWRYKRTLPEGTSTRGKKTIALLGDRLFAGTSDAHMLALDARTGRPVWDKAVTDRKGLYLVGGPLAARGVIMVGLAGQAPGGALIAGFDALTGAKLWSFDTIARPGTPEGDTWNGLTLDQRSGGSVWTSGSYDPVTGLALWGTGQTYDTGPLRDRKPGENNDALYTDSTLAFEPRTGRLVWYYQHMQNDQFDFDWVFDRVIGTIAHAGKTRRVVITGDKPGLFDAIDAATGQYVRTVDMGLQNFVTRIDPVTGRKTVNPDLIPDRTKVRYVCPHGGGGRNWSPTAFDQASATIFVNARDMCTAITPVEGRALLTTGVTMNYAPAPGSDGRFGMIRGLDMTGGTIRWTYRQRAPYSMGMLATAGGLLFTGSVDRMFSAHDQKTGALLWSQQLTGVPNAAPISYAVGGRQYVALVTGYGNALSLGFGALTPDIQLPAVVSSGVYVFALPD
jgi:alcohol dehydrogenase (cytochrome c)